eukprot:746278-Hanusia_phi.AAC.1
MSPFLLRAPLAVLLLTSLVVQCWSFSLSPSLAVRRASCASCASGKWGKQRKTEEDRWKRHVAVSVRPREAGVEEEEERSEEDGLPEDWRAAVDPATGRTYFWNVNTREATWYRPSSEKTLLRAARRLKEKDSSMQGQARRRAAQRRASELQQKLAAAENQKELKYMTRSPTKFVQKRMQSMSEEARRGEVPSPPPLLGAPDPFSSFLNLLERREQPAIVSSFPSLLPLPSLAFPPPSPPPSLLAFPPRFHAGGLSAAELRGVAGGSDGLASLLPPGGPDRLEG